MRKENIEDMMVIIDLKITEMAYEENLEYHCEILYGLSHREDIQALRELVEKGLVLIAFDDLHGWVEPAKFSCIPLQCLR